MHGYELIQQIAEKSNGTWKPSPGSIYPALSQLEDEGLVLIDKVAGRKTAALTARLAHLVATRMDIRLLAESVRFELTDGCPSAVFKTAGLNRSPNSPSRRF